MGNHGNTIDFVASVSPTAPGPLTDSFVLNTNLPSMPARSISLAAVALPAGVTPTPDLVHFGPGRVNTTTAAKTIELSNCGSAPIHITAARIEGASASDFAVVGPENPVMTLPQMGSVKFLVVMSPRQNGTKAAQLVVEYDGGTVTAELDGNGFGGDEAELLDRETYYACSTGGGSPTALAPLGLALLLLRRRRRA
jgi:MYXO-CTERM domain-containing protein